MLKIVIEVGEQGQPQAAPTVEISQPGPSAPIAQTTAPDINAGSAPIGPGASGPSGNNTPPTATSPPNEVASAGPAPDIPAG